MRARPVFRSSLALWLVAIACTACESNQQLGSACPGGVCPNQAAVQAPECLASTYGGEIALGEGADELCLPSALPLDDNGLPRCEVTWQPPWPDDQPGSPSCDGYDFLTGEPGCVVRQLTEAQRAAGVLAGWYYERDESGPCAASGAIRFSAGADLSEGVGGARFSCSIARARDEDGVIGPIALEQCASPPEQVDASGVGEACMPTIVPAGGFDPREAYVETGTQCATGSCLVFQLEGDPSSDCDPNEEGKTCATQAEVERSVYCSCRCDLPPGAPGEECECPDGYACQELLGGPSEAFSGGYCVSNAPVSPMP